MKDSRLNHTQHYLAAAAETVNELLCEGGLSAHDEATLLSAIAWIAAAKETVATASIYSAVVGA